MNIISTIITLVLFFGPIFHVRNILHTTAGQPTIPMDQQQKRAYLTSLSGVLMIIVATIMAFIVVVMSAIKLIVMGSAGVGYMIAFLIFPSLLFVIGSGLSCYIPLIYSIPTVYKNIQKGVSILFIAIGILSLGTVPLTMLLFSAGSQFFFHNVEIVEAIDQFHPLRHYTAVFFVGPLLLIAGGIMGLLDLGKGT